MDSTDNVDATLSKRGQYTVKSTGVWQDPMLNISNNIFHPINNPKGIVQLGVAINTLMDDEICERMKCRDTLDFQSHHIHYYTFSGTIHLKNAISNFLTRHLTPHRPVNPSNVWVTCGPTACYDCLGQALCDPDDVIITPSPVYGCIQRDFTEMAHLNVQFLHLSQDSFTLRAEDLEKRILELKSEGQRVRVFVLINPQNPMGDVYNADLILSLLYVCARYQIHVIVSEMYALSVFDDKANFCSVLSMDVPDPQRTHVIWGLSKDLCLAGLRVGVIITMNKSLHKYLEKSANYKVVPYYIQHIATLLLNDTKWIDDMYLPTMRQRLKAAYEMTKHRLIEMGAEVRPTYAGFCMWFSLASFLQQVTHQQELALHSELVKAGIYMCPGSHCHCTQPGWMRMTFTVNKQQLITGLDRLEGVLSSIKQHNYNSTNTTKKSTTTQ